MIRRSGLIAILLGASASVAMAQAPTRPSNPPPTAPSNAPRAPAPSNPPPVAPSNQPPSAAPSDDPQVIAPPLTPDQPAAAATPEDTSPTSPGDSPEPPQSGPTVDTGPALEIPTEPGPPATPPPQQTVQTIHLSDLPKVLDHDGTFQDAVADANGVRRSVIMGGLDKITARTFKFEAPVGTTVRFEKLLVTARMCYVRPPEETPETSAFLEIAQPPQAGGEDIQRIFSGWMFASSPGLNALEHPIYDVWVIGCHVDDPKNPIVTSAAQPGPDQPKVEKPSIDDSIKDDDAARE